VHALPPLCAPHVFRVKAIKVYVCLSVLLFPSTPPTSIWQFSPAFSFPSVSVSSSLSWQRALPQAPLTLVQLWFVIHHYALVVLVPGTRFVGFQCLIHPVSCCLDRSGGVGLVAFHLRSPHRSSHDSTVVLLLLFFLYVPVHHSPLRLCHSRVLGRPVVAFCLLHPVTSPASLPGSDLLRLFHLHQLIRSSHASGTSTLLFRSIIHYQRAL